VRGCGALNGDLDSVIEPGAWRTTREMPGAGRPTHLPSKKYLRGSIRACLDRAAGGFHNTGTMQTAGPYIEPENGARWLVVQTKPKVERRTVEHLAQRGVSAYCPLFLEPPWHLRAPRGPVPLFPGYIFAGWDGDERLDSVRYCPGVLRPVSFGGRPAVVGQALIEELRRLEGERGYILPRDFSRRIDRGRRVRIVGGPLRGMEGVFDGYLRGGERARVLLEMLRTRRWVEVDAGVIRAVR